MLASRAVPSRRIWRTRWRSRTTLQPWEPHYSSGRVQRRRRRRARAPVARVVGVRRRCTTRVRRRRDRRSRCDAGRAPTDRAVDHLVERTRRDRRRRGHRRRSCRRARRHRRPACADFGLDRDGVAGVGRRQRRRPRAAPRCGHRSIRCVVDGCRSRPTSPTTGRSIPTRSAPPLTPCSGTGGTPASRASAGSCSWRSPIPTRATPGPSAPTTPT